MLTNNYNSYIYVIFLVMTLQNATMRTRSRQGTQSGVVNVATVSCTRSEPSAVSFQLMRSCIKLCLVLLTHKNPKPSCHLYFIDILLKVSIHQ